MVADVQSVEAARLDLPSEIRPTAPVARYARLHTEPDGRGHGVKLSRVRYGRSQVGPGTPLTVVEPLAVRLPSGRIRRLAPATAASIWITA